MSDYANPDALATTEWLEQHLDDRSIRIVEVDEDTSRYDQDHIPGAISWNWSSDLHHPVRRDYIDQDALSRLLAASGVDDGTTVVLYGGNNNWFAAYAYWLLKYRGFDAVRLLDGGRKKWELEGREVVAGVPSNDQTDFRLEGAERPELRATRDEVLSKAGNAAFVDVRSPEEFSGEKLAPDHLPQEQPYVGGHVPGAINIPWSKAANEDGTFKDAKELRLLYEEAGVADGEVIAYCRIGERSSHTWFVLHELLGNTAAKNYDGSWTEYGSLVGAPVEVGS
jgi:thiosulfate/3-mercaptopyruvate sulfurtransferase